jgi:hypothetical protein
MDQETTLAINRALFQQEALAQIAIMNAKGHAKGGITAITHPNEIEQMALQYHDIIFCAARTVDKEVVDVQQNESWEKLKIHTVLLILYGGQGTEARQKMEEAFEAENEGIVITSQVRWVVNHQIIRRGGRTERLWHHW